MIENVLEYHFNDNGNIFQISQVPEDHIHFQNWVLSCVCYIL